MSRKMNIIALQVIVLLGLGCFTNGASISSSEELKSRHPVMSEALEEFVKVVEAHNLNVTIIRSNKQYYSDGTMKATMGLMMHMPTTGKMMTEGTLTPEATKDYSVKIKDLSKKMNLGAEFKMVKVTDGKSDDVPLKKETDPHMTIDTLNYDNILNVRDGEQGFSMEGIPTYEILYNYIVTLPGQETKNVKVMTGHVEIKVVKKSEGFTEEDVEAFKKMIPEYFMTTYDDTLKSKRMVEHMDEKMTGPCENYQVMIGLTDDFYLSTKFYVLFEIDGANMLVYCFPKK